MPRKPVRGKRSSTQRVQLEVVSQNGWHNDWQLGRTGRHELRQSAAEPLQLACELTPPEAYLAAYARTQRAAQTPDWRHTPEAEPAVSRAQSGSGSGPVPGVVIEIDIA